MIKLYRKVTLQIIVALVFSFSSSVYAQLTYSPWFDSISKYRVIENGLIVFVDGAVDATRATCWDGTGESAYIVENGDSNFDQYFAALIAAYHTQEPVRFVVDDLTNCVGDNVKFKFIIVGGP